MLMVQKGDGKCLERVKSPRWLEDPEEDKPGGVWGLVIMGLECHVEELRIRPVNDRNTMKSFEKACEVGESGDCLIGTLDLK